MGVGLHANLLARAAPHTALSLRAACVPPVWAPACALRRAVLLGRPPRHPVAARLQLHGTSSLRRRLGALEASIWSQPEQLAVHQE